MVRLFVTLFMGLVLLISVVNAEEKPMSLTSCRSGTVDMLSASKELAVYRYELKGIDQDRNEDKTFENFTHRCMGVSRVQGDVNSTSGYCKYMDPDGDFWIVEFNGESGGKKLPWTFIQGTGKWKGIKGGGTAQNYTRGKPIAEGTFQMCTKIEGTYELPQ
jgi:hypothetical protein